MADVLVRLLDMKGRTSMLGRACEKEKEAYLLHSVCYRRLLAVERDELWVGEREGLVRVEGNGCLTSCVYNPSEGRHSLLVG